MKRTLPSLLLVTLFVLAGCAQEDTTRVEQQSQHKEQRSTSNGARF